MTTRSIRPVTRETSALVRERGLRPLIVTVVGGVLELRAKGLRSAETVDLASVYYSAVRQRVSLEKSQRRAGRATGKRAASKRASARG